MTVFEDIRASPPARETEYEIKVGVSIRHGALMIEEQGESALHIKEHQASTLR